MIVTGRALAVQKRRNKDVHSEYNTSFGDSSFEGVYGLLLVVGGGGG